MTEEARDAEMWLLNLHDVFLTGNLMRTLMKRSPICPDAEEFMASDRGRLERCWHRDLYVLCEAWREQASCRQGRVRSLARTSMTNSSRCSLNRP